MTTEEFAKQIGVSRVTLSKVINGREGVSKKSKDKIEKAIAKHNFVPSSSARSLAGKQNKIIGLFTKDSSINRNDDGITAHYYSEFTDYLIDELQKLDYKTLISIVSDKKDYAEIEKSFKSGLISGGVLLGYEKDDDELIKVTKKGYKLALIHQEREVEAKNTLLINMDDEKGAYRAIETLIENGHKDILYIGSNHNRLGSYEREKGAIKCKKAFSELVENFHIENGNFTKESGYKAVKNVFIREVVKPSGIFCANDFMALGAIKAVKEMGYKVPEDISIIGFDDLPILEHLTPRLTTVKYDIQEMARKTATSLINLIDGKETNRLEICPTVIVERDTVKNMKTK